MIVVVAVGLLVSGLVSPTLGIALVAVAGVVEVAEVWLWIRYLKRFRVATGVEAMVGEQVVVTDRCKPEGTVRFRGELWSARCEAGAAPGERVRVAAVDGLTLVVERSAAGRNG